MSSCWFMNRNYKSANYNAAWKGTQTDNNISYSPASTSLFWSKPAVTSLKDFAIIWISLRFCVWELSHHFPVTVWCFLHQHHQTMSFLSKFLYFFQTWSSPASSNPKMGYHQHPFLDLDFIIFWWYICILFCNIVLWWLWHFDPLMG